MLKDFEAMSPFNEFNNQREEVTAVILESVHVGVNSCFDPIGASSARICQELNFSRRAPGFFP